MNITYAVLIAAAATTIWLVFYVQYYLPRRLEERFRESMKAFSKAIELRFPANSGRTEEIIRLAVLIGKRFGCTRTEIHELELAVYLRDIGCCALPYRPFNEKPRTEWSEAELTVYNRHPEVSGAMLELVPSLRHVAETVRWHHARFDGKGSPGSPVGVALPLNARILRVASDFVWDSEEVGEGATMRALIEGKGTEYCPEVVEELEHVLTSSRVQEPKPSIA